MDTEGPGTRSSPTLFVNGVTGAQPHSFFYILSALLSHYSESQVIKRQSLNPKALKSYHLTLYRTHLLTLGMEGIAL